VTKGPTDSNNPAAGCIGDATRGTYTHLGNKKGLVETAFLAAGFEPVLEESTMAPDPGDAGADAGDAGTDAAPGSTTDGGKTDAGKTDAGPRAKLNGSKCAKNTDCLSFACFEGYCRAQCRAGDCAVGSACATKGEFKLCVEGAAEESDGEDELDPKTSAKTPSVKPAADASSSSSCSTAPVGSVAETGAWLGIGLALAAFATRRRAPRA
jgi:hypothetical protein